MVYAQWGAVSPAMPPRGRSARLCRGSRPWAADRETDKEAIAREPTPDEAAMLAETLEQLMRPMDQRQRKMVVLVLQGLNEREISDNVGRSQRTVRRLLQRVKAKLESMCKEN